MPRTPRKHEIDENCVGTYHCVNRCVRRAFLCGQDHATGLSYGHRRRWIEQRIAALARVFQIDILGYGIMSNHFHIIVRNRPDKVRILSDQKVIERWLSITEFRNRPNVGLLAQQWSSDKSKVQQIRKRLSSISWFMRYLNQSIAVSANREEGISGRFWQGRFKSWIITNYHYLLSAMTYVDLNPIRGGMAKNLKRSFFTSIHRRIQALQLRRERKKQEIRARDLHRAIDDWLCPIEICINAKDPMEPASGRASNDGCLPMTLERYIAVVDWAGRRLHSRSIHRIPPTIPTILIELGIESPSSWFDALQDYASEVRRKLGKPSNNSAESALLIFNA